MIGTNTSPNQELSCEPRGARAPSFHQGAARQLQRPVRPPPPAPRGATARGLAPGSAAAPDDPDHLPERIVILDLVHIVKLEPLETVPPPGTDGVA
jgi:hypothetical protein